MSSLLGLLFVSVSVGLSNFAGAIGIGISGVDARTRLRVGIAFGLFEALMPVLGLLIGQSIAGSLGAKGRYVGAVLLVLTGAWTIYDGRKPKEAGSPGSMNTRKLALTALALSLDNLVVGFALGVYKINIVLAAAVIGVVSVGMSLIGLELGSRLGARVEEWSEEIGGAVLVLVGIALGAGVLK
jgi:putative Mn2+ efflux pump MntP